MGNKIIMNPVTRISGFLEIQVEVEENKIIDAKCGGMLFRGFEKMLKGRPPLDAVYFTQRICGICSTAHSIGSTSALEDVLDIIPNDNDKMIRDFIHGCEIIQNHLRHYYQYSLPDYVKGVELQLTQIEMHNDYRLPENLNKELANHYLDSFRYGRLAHEMLTVLGGKAPHNHGVFVGGVTVNLDASKWIKVKSTLAEIKDFVENVMIPDVYVISEYYSDYFENGVGYRNLMTYGLFDNYKEKQLFFVEPQVFIDGEVYVLDSDKITENIQKAWFEANQIVQKPTELTVEENANKEGAYSWIKAPRYDGYVMEVGPLARMILSGNYKRGISTMDRLIARVLETKKIIEIMEQFLERMKFEPANQRIYEFPYSVKGKGLADTSRGALGHWIYVQDQEIYNYEIITPSAWNLSPEDSKGLKGAAEKALIGTTIKDMAYPVEIGRIIRSFDPCISCATHVESDRFAPMDIRIV
ncbi:nickel-dependent hydrogenase large subunit [Anaerosacchariphilus polymeriproducens]|uniref:Ni/Fe hydrogenase n=1 Tax=Anaerosacchariphilus polymeriproducens TaxID=1812858 RepID=A0A371ASJ4_9FIRM|nr:nickel-dependent hydrogenase large subunit [Anaerosacchariphilus polymeriproducens]RDU22535.1 Ni/Fe hydrogenase [Anaerosacchariphilus polymeriproducens]